GEHRQVGHDGHLQRAGRGEFDWVAIADRPAYLGGTEVGAQRGDGGENQNVGQVHVADGFLFATDFLPLLVGMGEEPPNMVDHADTSSFYNRSPPSVAPDARDQRRRVQAESTATVCRSIGEGRSPRESWL